MLAAYSTVAVESRIFHDSFGALEAKSDAVYVCRDGGPNPSAETNRNEHTRRSIIFSFLVFCHVLRSLRPAKRSRALVETNPARNSRSETHQDDGSGSRLRTASFLALHRVDRSPYAWKNSLLPFHQPPQARFFFRSLLVSDSPVRNGVVARCSSVRQTR